MRTVAPILVGIGIGLTIMPLLWWAAFELIDQGIKEIRI